MKIKSISIENIKSFKKKNTFDLFEDFNILIGPNGSGKSNFMDILCVVIRYFFLKSYKLVENNYGDGIMHKILQDPEQYPSDILLQQLEKYLGNENTPSKIEIEFIVTNEDIQNIQNIIDRKNELKEVLCKKYSYQNQHQYILDTVFKAIDEWNSTLLVDGDILKYSIIDSTINIATDNDKNKLFYEYLNYYELIIILAKDLTSDISLTTNYLYIGPHRNVNQNSSQINLSQINQYEILYNYMNSTSRGVNNLIEIASFYFAQKHRKFECELDGYKKLWEEDENVKRIAEYLKLIGYSWEMDVIDSNKNIYEIVLKEGERRISLEQASSGERELINFLLGIYSFKIIGGIVIIDEPELHLHPRWQKLLLKLFKELSKKTNNQFIISTHAPAFISIDSYEHLHRIYKDLEQTSQHTTFNSSLDLPLKIIHQIITATNSEQIFFADAIILVEGITDRLVFQKILNDKLASKNKIIEIVEIRGKTNIEHFRKFLTALNIPDFFIADLDFVNQTASAEIKKLLIPKWDKIATDVIKNYKSLDGEKLCNELENALKSKNLEQLEEIWIYIKSTRTKFKELDSEEQIKLDTFIEQEKARRNYILKRGEIEAYFPKGHKNKDLEKVINLLNEDKDKWSESNLYEELEEIVENILDEIQ